MSGELIGSPASPGSVFGPVARMSSPPELPERWDGVDDAATEVARALSAMTTVSADLRRRAEPLTGEARDILEVQAAMAADPAIEDGVREAVEAGSPAAWALRDSFDAQIAKLAALGGYLAERTTDLADLRDRAIAAVLGLAPPGLPVSDKPYVLVSADLAPADTVTLDATGVLAIVTEKGGPTSHTAIVARALGIPAVVACAAAAGLADGDEVLVDGTAGTVVRDPDPTLVAEVERQATLTREALARYSGPGATKDGHPVKLLLNVGGSGASGADAEGVGLFRTEFLFLDRTEAPSVAEQRSAYGKVFAEFGGRPVVIRTLDAGADKPVPFANADAEPNPALGVRGYRVGVRNPSLLEAQLEAIALAARDHDAQVQVMAPMIATPAEAAEFARIARAQGIERVGVMIEIPAAAILADEILAEVDFVSIGTNDLSQYTFAADRMLGELGALLDPWQPALLHLIARVAAAGTLAGKPVGICGEAASDPGLAPVFAGMGVTSLSMSAPAIPAVRAALRGLDFAECQALAQATLK